MIEFALGALIGAGSTESGHSGIATETASSPAGALGEDVIRAVTTVNSARTMRQFRPVSEIVAGHEPRPLGPA